MAEAKKVEKKVTATAAMYDILRRPVISEKAAKLAEANAIAFEVSVDATKEDIARAVTAIYGAKPEKINIVVTKGKVKGVRFKGGVGKTKTVKKAYVTLPKDVKIEIQTA